MTVARALVVDDDPGMLDVLEMLLQSMGLDVALARNYREAVALLDDRGFDVALFDLRMESANGLRLMEAAHVRQPRLPVVIMTTRGTIDNAVEALRQGAFDYLTKPFVPAVLRGKVGRALSQRRWTRDRALLKTVGDVLASSGTMERVLEAIAQATVEATEAERAVVFLREGGRLLPMSSAGAAPGSTDHLATTAMAVIERRIPTTVAEVDGRVTLGSPLFVGGGVAGAIVVETRVQPTEDDLDLLALFSSQAAVALKNTRELERLRSGALAALGSMAAEMAHELRNPLAALKLFAEYLELRLGNAGDGEGADVAGKIGREVDHMADLVREITLFGRPGSLRRVPTSLNPLLESCLPLAQARVADRVIRVALELDPALPPAALDPREMRKVFLSLIVNAREAMDSGGTLTLRTRAAEPGLVEVTVEDTGCGMNEEARARAFELFFTTKDDRTGLGMAIARTVVEQHGGRMEIRSRIGRGTQVRVLLPLAAP